MKNRRRTASVTRRARLALSVFVVIGVCAPTSAKRRRVAFEDESRSVKVVLVSSSLGKWRFGGFHQYLERACTGPEILNRSEYAINTAEMTRRFRKDVLRNPSIDTKTPGNEYWVLYQGGLNSVGNPAMTIRDMSRLFVLAHEHGFKVAAVSVTPWGGDTDRRFDHFHGLEMHDKTRRLVDYLMGRLPRNAALGRFVEKSEAQRTEWKPSEMPDIAVDVLSGELRHVDAPLRKSAPLRRRWTRDRKWRRLFPDPDEAVKRAQRVPRWFPNPKLAMDHVHYTHRGHRVIAAELCRKLPTSWGCDCPLIPKLGYQRGMGVVVRDR